MGQFSGPFSVTELPGSLREGRQEVTTAAVLTYISDKGYIISVPRGFATDFASVPFWLDGIVPSFGPWAKAAIIHDYLYAGHGAKRGLTRAWCDNVFREALKACGVSLWRRNAMWAAVRLGGGNGWVV